jgi:predicted naringenin-chalcone synthase
VPDGNNRVEVVDTFSEVVLGTEAMVTWGVGGEATLSKDLPSLVKSGCKDQSIATR